ncbi:MAG: baaA1 [Parcubacteria group bacterium]|nr:baaA1 [Parcubacteria group bacterium]
MRNTAYVIAAVLLLAGTAVLIPSNTKAAVQCTFTTDLTLGVQNEQVRCLQKYLNENGFAVSDTGVGSKGYETNQYKDKTVAAVKRWQAANGISPATGTFGPMSRAKYNGLSVITPTPVPTPVPTPTPTPTPVPVHVPTVSSEEKNARNAIQDAIDELDNANSDIDDAKDNGDDLGKSVSYASSANKLIVKALYSFIDEEYGDAENYASDAQDAAQNAQDEIGGGSSDATKSDANNALNDADDAINNAQNEIDDANGDTNDAEDYLNDAEDKYDDARNAYDDKDYDKVVDLAGDAESLAKKAIKAL